MELFNKQMIDAFLIWEKQGRTDEQRYAVQNFLTGAGIKGIKNVIKEENNRVLDILWKKGHGGGNWKRLIIQLRK